MKKLIIISIVLILVNITSAYFLTRRENLYMNNRDDNSFFHANQKFGYAEGLSDEIYYHRNNKDLIKKIFFGCSLLDYERIHFNDYISIHAYNNDNSFQDSFAFCEFTLNGTLDKKDFDTYFQLLEEFNQCFEKRDIQDYKYMSDIEIKDFDSSTNTYYLEAKATIFFYPELKEMHQDKYNLCNKSDIEIGKKLYEYDFQLYQQNIDKKINKIHKIKSIIISISIVCFFIVFYLKLRNIKRLIK